ncbi:MAG: hypothetical protein HONDAALG_03090 [Gammaproteobacteria bacterium]|nr:hypothetical protein [Gammaproteobacteria bacterium]
MTIRLKSRQSGLQNRPSFKIERRLPGFIKQRFNQAFLGLNRPAVQIAGMRLYSLLL